MELDEMLQTNEETSDSVGVMKFVEEYIGALVGMAGSVPVVGQPAVKALGYASMPFQRAQSAVFGGVEAAAQGGDLTAILKRASQGLLGEKATSATAMLKALGIEDRTGITPLALSIGMDTLTGAGLAKVGKPILRAGVEAIPKLGPKIKGARIAREQATLAGEDLSVIPPVQARGIEQQLLTPIDEPLKMAQEERMGFGKAARAESKSLKEQMRDFLPPVPKGHTRLYRGFDPEGLYGGVPPGMLAEGTEGRWFTADPNYASRFAGRSGQRGMGMSYLDLPDVMARAYHIPDVPAWEKITGKSYREKEPFNLTEFMVPRNIAKSAKTISQPERFFPGGFFDPEAASGASLAKARMDADKLSKQAFAEARALRDKRPVQLLSADIPFPERGDLEALISKNVVPEKTAFTYRTYGERKALGLKPMKIGEEPILFSGRIKDQVKPARDFVKNATLQLARKAVVDPNYGAFFGGRWRPMHALLSKLGALEPAVKAQRAYFSEYEAAMSAARAKAKELGIEYGSESSKRVAMALDGMPVQLTLNEKAFHDWWRTETDGLARRLGFDPSTMGPDSYFTHMASQAPLWADGFGGSRLTNDMPEWVVDPYLKKRTGESLPRYDALEAFQVYQRAGLRKVHFDPLLREVAPIVEKLPDRLKNDAKNAFGVMIGRPSVIDQSISNSVAKVFGKELNIPRASRWALGTNALFYAGLLGGNLGTALKQITQSVNTAMEVGFGRTFRAVGKMMGLQLTGETAVRGVTLGKADLFKRIGTGLREAFTDPLAMEYGGSRMLQKAGMTPAAQLKTGRVLGWVQRLLMMPATFADRFSRGVAFIAHLDEALERGFSTDFALRQAGKGERATQFIYGAMGRAPATQSGILAPVFMFSQYPLNQIELITSRLLTGKFEPLVRLAVATGWASSVAQDMGIDLSSIETPLSIQDAKNYLTLRASPPIKVLQTVMSLADTDFDDPKDVESWRTRFVESMKAMVPLIPRARLMPGAAEVADFSDLERFGAIPLKNPQGFVTRLLGKGDYAMQVLGIPRTAETRRRETVREAVRNANELSYEKVALEKDILRDIDTGEDFTGHLNAWVLKTGLPIGKLVTALMSRADDTSKTRLERLFSDLPAALKVRYAKTLAEEWEKRANMPGLAEMVGGLTGSQ